MRRVSGFTLIELMMVVAILGILAVVAIPRYRSYLYRSKTTEAVGFLAEIKSRQESYRADFGQYCNVSTGITDWYPSGTPSSKPLSWPSNPASGTTGSRWLQLGATPPGNATLFQYQSLAGPPGADNRPSWGGGLGYTGADFWFVSRAQADLDGNGTTMLMESYSASPNLYIDPPSGWN